MLALIFRNEADDADPREHENAKEAIMDIIDITPFDNEMLLDASVRNPLAKRHARHAFSRAGFAAGTGECDKWSRYPTTAGEQVIPCVVESFGRIGDAFHHFFDTAAALVASRRQSCVCIDVQGQ